MSSPASQLFTEREHLTSTAYADSKNLHARVSIYHYRDSHTDFVDWALSHINWPKSPHVLDVGCGYGQYLKKVCQQTGNDIFLTGVDLSSGMVQDLSQQWDRHTPLPHLGIADVQHLPFSDNSYDIVLAMHMLYHVPDIEQAIVELHRILRPGGTVLVSTNGQNHCGEIEAIFCEALRNSTGDMGITRFFPRVSRRFALENGATLLRTAFRHVEQQSITDLLQIPAVTPVLMYADSIRPTIEKTLPDEVTWEEIVQEATQLIQEQIIQHGVFKVQTHTGVFLCT
ncbi:MAG: class I SAM-dependent methyltransferase [Chloroflexota bacterium]